MSIIESLLVIGQLIEQAMRSVATAANGGQGACADRSLRLTAAIRERWGCSSARTDPSGHRLKAVGAQMKICGEDGAAERMRRRKLAGLSEPKWRLADSPKRGGEPVAQLMQVAHPLLDLESGRGALVPAAAAAQATPASGQNPTAVGQRASPLDPHSTL